jgi:hypothetical protein
LLPLVKESAYACCPLDLKRCRTVLDDLARAGALRGPEPLTVR